MDLGKEETQGTSVDRPRVESWAEYNARMDAYYRKHTLAGAIHELGEALEALGKAMGLYALLDALNPLACAFLNRLARTCAAVADWLAKPVRERKP